MTEDREPGAIEDEPFDVVRANSSLDDSKGLSPTKSRSFGRRTTARNNYEVADLPALSRSDGSTVDVSSTKDASIVTGGLSGRTRPMSPPSRAGLDDPAVYLKTNTTEDTSSTPTSQLVRESSYRSDMPMDERQEYEEEMKALALCDIGEGSQGMPEFCDTALQAVNEMCAGGLSSTGAASSPSKRVDKDDEVVKSPKSLNLKLGEKHSPSAAGVEEQTAIEVEYVEPLYRGKDDYGSPRRKNAIMKAMSRKAKDDWKTKGGGLRRSKANESVVEAALNELAEQPNDNVYATFTNAEKRKFLQLINGGSSPFESTSRVLKERAEAAAMATDQSSVSVADSSFRSDSDNPKSPPRTPSGSRGRSRNKLVFWKNKKKSGSGSAPSTPTSKQQQQQQVLEEVEKPKEEIYEDDASSGESSCEKVGDEIKQFLKEEAESVKSVKEEPGFVKSGISYYDAVRKDRSMEEEDEYYNDGAYPEESKRGGRKIKLPKGFSGFPKFKNKGTPVAGEEGGPVLESHRSIPSPQTAFDEEKKAESEDGVGKPTETPKSPEEIVDELNMDAYMGSSRILNSSSFDATSVVSGKSHKTSGTTFTTQSTRSRRRGQAKVRLEHEKSILNISMESTKTRGWQESIERAAAASGKVWDPETGFRDYVDPKQLDNSTDGFYSQSVDITDLRENKTGDSARPTSPTQLPLWKEIKKPPREIQKPPTTPTRNANSPGRSRKSPKRGGASVVSVDEKPRGWAATMKAATAKLNMQGKNWDPEKGWTGLSEDEAKSVNDAMRQLDDIAITASSDMQDFGTLNTLDEIASKQDKSMQFLSEEEEADANINDAESATNDGDLSSSALSSSNKSKTSGKYIQIAATGSVQEYQRGGRNRPVIVRKQDLDQDDADYFPEGSSSHVKGPIDLDDLYEQESASPSFRGKKETKVVAGASANKVYQKIYESQGNGSFDDAVGTDFSWDADEATEHMDNTDYTRKAVPRLKIKIRDSAKNSGGSKAQSESSFDSSNSIPRLAAPKRDTSPIRSTKSKSSSKGTPTSESMSPAAVSISPAQDTQNDQNVFRDPQEEDIVEIPPPAVKETIGGGFVPISQDAPPPPMDIEGSRSPVAELHKMWEKRTKSWDKDAKQDVGPDPKGAPNQEWKSFLHNKVQAETAAAAAAEGSDSVFDFDEHGQKIRKNDPNANSAFDDLSELSPIRHDEESDSEYGTRASTVVSETSTSVLQGTTFLQRLQACAAPVVTKGKQFAQNQNCSSDGPIAQQLAFLRNTPGANSKAGGILQASAGLCGKPDTISEVGEEASTVGESLQTTPTNDRSLRKERSRSNPRSRQNNKDDLSSVVSDGFGAQSAYLEAIAMKAATGGKKKKKRPQSEASGASGTQRSEASAKSGHSEKFQQFLDRRASREQSGEFVMQQEQQEQQQEQEQEQEQLPDHKPPRSDVSSRAEKYASEKVNEMMDSMADRDNRETGAFPTATTTTTNSSSTNNKPTNDASRVAAEELAAARVEVMMQTLSSQNLEDNEAEI
eukprot:CAMPEP_0116130754 /NCGR_PEP_ID=MMETSP0329-20121206/8646_1 /TAXON_ID=697910 /ORGANISM="Pseudo-nitzschia arenysensis, Strain B593" /LENGTH=1517 /DNA_ID=CAMNT_0003625149 /DNA_START=176 /DNA_END=4729 /DNA_ORIENTATION=+